MTTEPRFELRDHTADIGVWASADDLAGLFAAVADGLAAASCETPERSGGERFSLAVTAESLEALLFEYLDELIYLRDVRLELPVENEIVELVAPGCEETEGAGEHTDEEFRLEATARGLPLDAIDAREIKAVTYSEMRIERVEDGWEGYVVFDV
ncbi:archease [Saliphagus sp. LR7]|uniref:archease n=1 Tax=Saliphagus sp. LR7 TaxID=2282654 RepID=UPI000DF82DCD|nr:archease [Saliphagus sp. LR7]